ncbi:unnamed protein product [Gordionus sp. m RMFG-2023]|uniref:glutathione peroxidase 7-like n=1 Tax=Gordionus sp. m RMFG-2023 TaxID=3053472 RepID=UPI0030E54BFD
MLAIYVIFLFTNCYLIFGKDVYSFNVTDIEGNNVPLEKYKGKVSLIVNVASKCGYTDKQYKGLVWLQKEFEIYNLFNVLAFPCNQFWEQEPETNANIFKYVKATYKVNFPMFAKIDVISRGWEKVDPLWLYIGEVTNSPPTWNFWKYLVDKNGQIVSQWGQNTDVKEIYPIIKSLINEMNSSDDTKKRTNLKTDL